MKWQLKNPGVRWEIEAKNVWVDWKRARKYPGSRGGINGQNYPGGGKPLPLILHNQVGYIKRDNISQRVASHNKKTNSLNY